MLSDKFDKLYPHERALKLKRDAAPDLYEALTALRLQVLQSELNNPANEYAYEALQMANAALAKARGQA